MEFSDYRPYVPGDDLRLLDMTIYRRHGRLFVRQYEEQRESDVYVLIDVSGSMGSPSASKLRSALRLGAALGYLGLVGLDRVTAVAIAGDEIVSSRVLRGRARTLALLRFLENLKARGGTRLAKGAREFVRQGGRPGMAVLLTDGYDPEDTLGALDALRAFRHEPTLVQLVDDSYLTALPIGEVELSDAETGEHITRRITEASRRELISRQERRREALRRAALARGVRSEVLRVDEPLPHAVRRLVGKRRA